jgi:Cof subfamily protein (haloacid dehalogenase superfamily)
VKLVALDIDGTIVAHGQQLPSARLTAAVRHLGESGIAIVLASGRMYPGTGRIARHLGLTTPVICQQGCTVHAPGGAITHEFPIAIELAHDIVVYAKRLEKAYEWFSAHRYLVSQPGPEAILYGELSGITPEFLPEPEHLGICPTGVGIVSSPAEANAIHRAIVAMHGDALHVLDFPAVTVAVAPDANKGHALSLICQDLGVDRHDVVAIGDSVNDAAMLAWAGHGIALAHGDAYARDAADEVLVEDGHDVVAAWLERLTAAR